MGSIVFSSSVGATPVPLTGNHLVSIWGQSNAVGAGPIADLEEEPLASSDPGLTTLAASPFERVFIWGGGGSFEALEMGVNNAGGASAFGPEFGLAVRWARESASGNLYLMKLASAAQPIAYFDPITGVYGGGVATRESALTWLAGQAVTLDSNGWLWVQGESDNLETQEYYETELAEIIAAFLADEFLAATDMRVLVQMLEGTGGYSADIVAAKAAVAAADPNVTKLVTMADYFLGDNVHIDARGQLQLGYDAFEKLFGTINVSA